MSNDSGQANSYDEVPYPSLPFPQTHPGNVATIARLFGMSPVSIENCRVLEIGCASGGNLIPMAAQMPNSRFLGIDFSEVQVSEGKTLIDRVGLKNCELKHLNILDVNKRLGTFDYIIAHGVYSWVPDEVQNKILDICAKQLNPQGVAYISYNTYPGWHMRGMIRNMMKYHTSRFDDNNTRIRQARALLNFLSQNTSEENAYGMTLRRELAGLQNQSDSYLFHEFLEEVNEPIYFHEFIARAGQSGLQHLGEARMSEMWSGHLNGQVASTINRIASDQVQVEQYIDFIRNRTFRQTLLCHEDITVDRDLLPGDLESCHIACPLVSEDPDADPLSTEPMKFKHRSRDIHLTTQGPLMKAALMILADAWPAAVPYQDLVASARKRVSRDQIISAERQEMEMQSLGRSILEGYVSECIELTFHTPFFRTETSDCPKASKLARIQAESGNIAVTNLRHELCVLSDLSRQVIQFLDGTHDRAAIEKELENTFDSGKLVMDSEDKDPEQPASKETRLQEATNQSLAEISNSALLTSDVPAK